MVQNGVIKEQKLVWKSLEPSTPALASPQEVPIQGRRKNIKMEMEKASPNSLVKSADLPNQAFNAREWFESAGASHSHVAREWSYL